MIDEHTIRLSQAPHFEPEEEEHYPYPVLIIIGLCGLAWSVIAAGYWLVG